LQKNNIYEYVQKRSDQQYVVIKRYVYYSKRYNATVTALVGDVFDGATGALDINSFGWIVHDVLCRDGCFDSGKPCNNWQASKVLADILKSEGRWFRRHTWFVATWLFGGGKARANGLV